MSIEPFFWSPDESFTNHLVYGCAKAWWIFMFAWWKGTNTGTGPRLLMLFIVIYSACWARSHRLWRICTICDSTQNSFLSISAVDLFSRLLLPPFGHCAILLMGLEETSPCRFVYKCEWFSCDVVLFGRDPHCMLLCWSCFILRLRSIRCIKSHKYGWSRIKYFGFN